MSPLLNPLIVGAFLMGFFGGAHCVAMCGGVVGVLCSATRAGCPASVPKRTVGTLAYNAGRLASYSLLGLLFASFGALTTNAAALDVVRYALRGVAALAMLAVGLHLLGLPSLLARAEGAGAILWRRLSPLAKRLLPLQRPHQAFLLGGLWGLMPCGLLYGALALAASAETPLGGAAVMAAFGAGTLPALLTMSAFAQTLARAIARGWVRRTAGVVVLGFGLFSTAGLLRQTGLGVPFGLAASHHCCPTSH